MSSRLELELTSKKPDDSWTWRKAGAKEPRGVLQASILYEGAKVGDIVRAEVNFELDGIFVESVLPPQRKEEHRGTLIEIAPQRASNQLSSVEYARSNRPKSKDGNRKEESSERRGGDSRERTRRVPSERNSAEGGSLRTGESRGGDSRERTRRVPSERNSAEGGSLRTGESRGGDSRERTRRVPSERNSAEGGSLRTGESRGGERRGPRIDSPNRSNEPGRTGPRSPANPSAPRYAKVNPASIHRDAFMKAVPDEHRPIAEQLMAGGLPAVRNAIANQNQEHAKEGKTPMPADPILSIAEELLPSFERANWQDRAEAVLAVAKNVGLRDLKTVVSFGERVARSEELTTILNQLKELLNDRTKVLESDWTSSIEEALDENKSIKAVRLSSRAPDLSSKLAPELLERLANAANETLSPTALTDHWIAMLSALETSPIRKMVKPSGLPENPPTELLALAQQMSGRIPNLASLLGIKMPPPPRPRRKIGDVAKVVAESSPEHKNETKPDQEKNPENTIDQDTHST